MTQKIINGFPQYFDFTNLKSHFHGSAATEADLTKTDIDLLNDTIGDPISVDVAQNKLLTVLREGNELIINKGYEIVAPNIIRVSPGLIQGESMEFKFFTGAEGLSNTIPTAPPVPGTGGYDQAEDEAIAYTDNSSVPVNAYPAFVDAGVSKIRTHFPIDQGRLSVYVNGSYVTKVQGIWSVEGTDTIVLNKDYSGQKVSIQIVRNIVG